MNGFLKIGKECLEVPMFAEATQLRAGHGRRGAPLRELARALRQSEPNPSAVVLGADFGERIADLAATGVHHVLGLECEEDRFAFLERNARQLGGIAVQAKLEDGSLSGLFTRHPSFESARLLVAEGTQQGPEAIDAALAWIVVRHPVLALEVRLTDARSRDRWRTSLTSLAAAGYDTSLVLDSFEHPLAFLTPTRADELTAALEPLLTALDSARCHGGGLPFATVFLATRADRSLLERVCAALDTGVGSPGVHRIAVVRQDNLGDHVLGAGIFTALRAHYPSSKLVAVVPASLGELYARCPAIDAILTLPSFRAYVGNQALSSQIARYLSGCPKFDLVIHPRFAEDGYLAGLLCTSLAAPGARVLGFRQASSPIPGYDPNRYYTELLDASDTLHTARYTSVMAQAATRSTVTASPQVWFEPRDWERVARRWDLEPRGFIAVGVGTSYMNKRPTTETYRRMLRRLLDESLPIVLVGSADDRGLAETLRTEFTGGPRVIPATGALRLFELAALLANARIYVGPDAGPKHIAAAGKTPVLEISWVPADFPAISRGDPTAGRCWTAWDTPTRIVHPSREAFERVRREPEFLMRPSADVAPGSLEGAIDELLGLEEPVRV